MHDYRLYIPPDKIEAHVARLDGEEFHYCAHVLRRKEGAITVFDGVAHEWEASITSIERRHAVLHLGRLLREERPPEVRVLACPAILKGKALDDVVESAAELGAHGIVPVIAQRCDPNALKGDAPARLARWHRVAVAAVRQSGRIALPALSEPLGLATLLAGKAESVRVICARQAGADPLLDVLDQAARGASEIAVLVGPEAHFAPEEISAAVHAGARAAQLGPTTLRSGVAVTYALSVVSAWLAALRRGGLAAR
jgi:16S rRNA (uracil1498-N3)-methyltransferase